MAVPFGISVGDFLAVGNLAQKITKALNESRGSTAEYKSLCQLLSSLDRSLQVASAVFLYSSSSTGSSFNTHTGSLNGIRYELDCCKRLMEDFLADSKKHTETLLNGQGSRFKKEWRKVTWCLYKAEDVQKLQGSLQGHISAFNIYTSAIIGQNSARTEQRTIECADTGHRIEQKAIEISETTHRMEKNVVEISVTGQRTESMVRDMFTLFTIVQQDMPKVMEHIWKGESKAIQLEDALGRVVDLPFMLCIDQDSFHTILTLLFKNCPGQKRIAEKEYEITDESGTPIERWHWNAKVLPGAQIEMGIIFTKTIEPSNKSQTAVNICPRCSSANTRIMSAKGSLQWSAPPSYQGVACTNVANNQLSM